MLEFSNKSESWSGGFLGIQESSPDTHTYTTPDAVYGEWRSLCLSVLASESKDEDEFKSKTISTSVLCVRVLVCVRVCV